MEAVNAAPVDPVPLRGGREKLRGNAAAVLFGALPLYIHLTYLAVTGDPDVFFAGEWYDVLYDGIFYTALYMGWLYLFLRLTCRQRWKDLNLRAGSWLGDIGQGVLLWLATMVIMDKVYGLTAAWAPEPPPILESMIAAERSGTAMLLSILVYGWLAAAVFEEVLRAFFISRMFHISQSQAWRVMAVLLSALLFGAYHLYYGLPDALALSFSGLVYGTYFAWRGRLLPLIIAHGLHNSWGVLLSSEWYSQ